MHGHASSIDLLDSPPGATTMALSDLVPVRDGNIALASFLSGIVTSWVINWLDLPTWLLCAALVVEVISIVLIHVTEK